MCAYIVEVNVDAAKVVEHKVSDRVGALDGVGIAVKSLEEPGVFCGNELARLLVSPQLDGVSGRGDLLGAGWAKVPCTRSRGAGRCSSAGGPSSGRGCSR